MQLCGGGLEDALSAGPIAYNIILGYRGAVGLTSLSGRHDKRCAFQTRVRTRISMLQLVNLTRNILEN